MASTSKAKLLPVFNDNVAQLASTGAINGQAATGSAVRVWQLPAPGSSWNGEHDNIAGMAAPFNRDDANNLYSSCFADPGSPGSVGDLIALGTQIGYVGAQERAYRARHASPIRCMTVAAGRRIGHGDPAGVLLGGVVGYVQAVIAAGQTQS